MGQERVSNERLRLKYFQESLGSIREIKVLGKIAFLINKFSIFNKRTFEIIRNSGLITILPRLAIETLMVFLIASALMYFLFAEYDFNKIMIILGVLGACGFRMMPVITKLINSFNLIQYSKPSLDALYVHFTEEKTEKFLTDEKMNESDLKLHFDKVLEFENIAFKYNDKHDGFKFSDLNLKINMVM